MRMSISVSKSSTSILSLWSHFDMNKDALGGQVENPNFSERPNVNQGWTTFCVQHAHQFFFKCVQNIAYEMDRDLKLLNYIVGRLMTCACLLMAGLVLGNRS